MMNKTQVQAIRYETNRASRIHALLKVRADAEAEVAALLREELDTVGEVAWLAWCEREFGWKRTSAYKHLNPELMQAARDYDKESRQRSQPVNIDPTDHPNAEPAPTSTNTVIDDLMEGEIKEMARFSVGRPVQAVLADTRRRLQENGLRMDMLWKKKVYKVQRWINAYAEGIKDL